MSPKKTDSFTTKLPESYKITIPKNVREYLKLKEGDWLELIITKKGEN